MPILWKKCGYVKVFRNFTHQVDSLLERRQKEDNDMSVTNLGGYMTMTFLGYYDKVDIITKLNICSFLHFLHFQAGLKEERVRLELVLVKLSHKKRKESADPMVQVIQ